MNLTAREPFRAAFFIKERCDMPAILITGNVQTGKSTLIRRILSRHPEWRIGGFRTVSAPMEEGWLGVHLLPGDPARGECMPENRVGRRCPALRCREPIPGAFERLCPSLFETEGCDLLMMDELGGMEENAESFKNAVLNALHGPVPVLGVIKPRETPFLNAIRACPGVTVITLNEDNRNALLPETETALLKLMDKA